jgi:hypothetical protein
MLSLLKQKWVEWLISVILVIITVILTNSFAIKRSSDETLQKEIKEKASVEYVNQQDGSLKDYIDRQDDNTKEAVKSQTELIKSIDSKLNILINRPAR